MMRINKPRKIAVTVRINEHLLKEVRREAKRNKVSLTRAFEYALETMIDRERKRK